MKIIVVGGTGTIGKAVVKELSSRHSIVTVGHTSGDVQVDILDTASIEKMYKSLGKFDAVISATGDVHFGPLDKLTPELFNIGLKSKLMGQVNLVLIGLKYINNSGSFTLTSGILSDDPIVAGSAASMVNRAVDGFVIGSAIELPRDIRINSVSPTVLTESLPGYGDFFHGFESVPANRVALSYSKSVEGKQTGQIYKVWR
jgi:NAD(P)-dependent dehydrogenase (short-subunit alcohol dehydrogenase family)